MTRLDVLTPDQVVERWGGVVKRHTLANWRSKGRGPRYMRIGSRILYPLRDLELWEAAQAVGGEAGRDDGDGRIVELRR